MRFIPANHLVEGGLILHSTLLFCIHFEITKNTGKNEGIGEFTPFIHRHVICISLLIASEELYNSMSFVGTNSDDKIRRNH